MSIGLGLKLHQINCVSAKKTQVLPNILDLESSFFNTSDSKKNTKKIFFLGLLVIYLVKTSGSCMFKYRFVSVRILILTSKVISGT